MAVLERADRHRIALAGLQQPRRRDDAADRDLLAAARGRSRPGASSVVGSRLGGLVGGQQVGNRARAELLEVGGVGVDGVAGPEEAERFLLGRQQLGLRPGHRLGQRHGASRRRLRLRRSRRTGRPGPRSRSRCTRAPCSTAESMAAIEPRARHAQRQRLGAGGRRRHQRIERAGLDQRLEDALVRPGADRGLRTTGAATGCGRPAPCRTASIDSMAPSPTFLIAVRPKRTPCGVTVKRSSLSLMSGGSTGTPRSRHSPR